MTEIDTREVVTPDFERASNQEIVDYLKQNPEFGEYYSHDSGVWQNYTLEEHTLMVMGQFDRYFSDEFESDLISKGQFKLMLALHDVGKPLAVALYDDRSRQHETTLEIIPVALEDLEMDEKTKRLITAIPTQDIMGKFLKKHKNVERDKNKVVISVEEAESKVRELADYLEVPPSDLFDLLYMYFLSDTSSYTHDANPGMGEPPSERHEDLDHLFVIDRSSEKKGVIKLIPELEEKVSALRESLAS
jgi:hypothetical protein